MDPEESGRCSGEGKIKPRSELGDECVRPADVWVLNELGFRRFGGVGWVANGDAVDYGLGCLGWIPTNAFINGLGLMVIMSY